MKNFMELGSLELENERISQVMLPFIRLIDPLSKVKPEEMVYTSLKGGGSQANLYRFELNERYYVLRLLPPQAQRLIRMHQINTINLRNDKQHFQDGFVIPKAGSHASALHFDSRRKPRLGVVKQ